MLNMRTLLIRILISIQPFFVFKRTFEQTHSKLTTPILKKLLIKVIHHGILKILILLILYICWQTIIQFMDPKNLKKLILFFCLFVIVVNIKAQIFNRAEAQVGLGNISNNNGVAVADYTFL